MLVRASGGSGGRDEAVGHEISCSGNFCQLCGSTPRLLVSRCPSPMAAFHCHANSCLLLRRHFCFCCGPVVLLCPLNLHMALLYTIHEQHLVYLHRLVNSTERGSPSARFHLFCSRYTYHLGIRNRPYTIQYYIHLI